MSIRYRLERLSLRLLWGIAAKTRWERLSEVAEPLGWLFRLLFPSRFALAACNLRFALGLTESEAVGVAKQVFHHLALSVLEFLKLGVEPQEVIGWVDVKGMEAVREAWRKGQGVVIVTGHLGNFELMGARMAQEFPLWVVARPQSRGIWGTVKSIRERVGMRVVEKFGSVREAIKVLRKGEILGMVADQRAGKGATLVPFFRRKVDAFRAPALLAARTGAPFVFGYIVRRPDKTHEVILFPPISVGGDKVDAVTAWWFQRLEEAIRKAPEQWWWMHDRWRLRK